MSISSYEKEKALLSIAKKIESEKEMFSNLIIEETSKPIRYAKAEVERTISVFKIAAEESKRLPGEIISLDWTHSTNAKGYVQYFPIGNILGITPFNFPLNLVAHKIAPAIAAGCRITIKPSPKTPKVAKALINICNSVGLPQDFVSCLETPNNEVVDHVQSNEYQMVSFTGSSEIGWMIKANSGKKKVVLELGGNAACIVTETANLKKAVGKCIVGGFAFSGQVCIHTQRIYIHSSIFEVFKNAFIERVSQLKLGDPTKIETDVSDMITEEAAIRVENIINEAINEGANLLIGGNRKGKFIEPTVLTNTSSRMKISAQEVFGPVVTLEAYTDFDSVIREVNNSEYGLQAGIFTDSNDQIKEAYNELDVGGLIVNDVPTFRADHMPYGGIKNSGFGREGIKYSINEMLEAKLLVN